tara:strand:+ start:48 stop:410 length:363 start_codon:yes stop_codon:yes gene_type:complete
MINEAKFYQYLKSNTPELLYTRLENIAALGTPDILAYNKKHTFFTIELKVTKRYKLRFSPHQVSFHVRHPYNSFIIATTAAACYPILYEGYQIRQLAASGLKLAPCVRGLEAIYKKLREL